MTTDKTLELTLAPLRHLSRSVVDLDSYLILNKLRWFVAARDEFSWVYGISEVEIRDLAQRYENSRNEIKNIIKRTENENLRDKLENEFKFFPHLKSEEFVLDTDSAFWILKTFKPLKKIRKTIKFKAILSEIKRTCDSMINYHENVEWIELENVMKKTGG